LPARSRSSQARLDYRPSRNRFLANAGKPNVDGWKLLRFLKVGLHQVFCAAGLGRIFPPR
jgi:hypothetical protein